MCKDVMYFMHILDFSDVSLHKSPKKSQIPKEPVEITLDAPDFIKKRYILFIFFIEITDFKIEDVRNSENIFILVY